MKEIENILTALLECNRADLYTGNVVLNDMQINRLNSILFRRAKGEPLQYIIGYTEFMGLRFKVNKDVFIPRPETELLVEAAINMLKGKKQYFILDLCTGSGTIAVCLAKYITRSKITATDISNLALKMAKENALLNKVSYSIKFIRSDLLSYFKKEKQKKFDLIISNPPYIPTDEISKLAIEIKHEPRMALDAECDGLKFYRRIIKESPSFLKKSGLLMMEIGYNQAEAIKEEFLKHSRLKMIQLLKDYNKFDRIVIAKLKLLSPAIHGGVVNSPIRGDFKGIASP